jgi:hypothetical protein
LDSIFSLRIHDLSFSAHGLSQSSSSPDPLPRADVSFRVANLRIQIEKNVTSGSRVVHPLFVLPLPPPTGATLTHSFEGMDQISSSLAFYVAVSVSDPVLALLFDKIADAPKVSQEQGISLMHDHLNKRVCTFSINLGPGSLIWDTVPFNDWLQGIAASTELVNLLSANVVSATGVKHQEVDPASLLRTQQTPSKSLEQNHSAEPHPMLLFFVRNVTAGIYIASQCIIFSFDASKNAPAPNNRRGKSELHANPPLIFKTPSFQFISVDADKIDISFVDFHVFHHRSQLTNSNMSLSCSVIDDTPDQWATESTRWLHRYIFPSQFFDIISPWSIESSLHLRDLRAQAHTLGDPGNWQFDARLATKPLLVHVTQLQIRSIFQILESLKQLGSVKIGHIDAAHITAMRKIDSKADPAILLSRKEIIHHAQPKSVPLALAATVRTGKVSSRLAMDSSGRPPRVRLTVVRFYEHCLCCIF